MKVEIEEEEHEVYGGEIPEVGEMEVPYPDIDMSAADDDDAIKELNEMKRRLKEMEEKAARDAGKGPKRDGSCSRSCYYGYKYSRKGGGGCSIRFCWKWLFSYLKFLVALRCQLGFCGYLDLLVVLLEKSCCGIWKKMLRK